MIYCVEDDGSIRDLMLYTMKSAGFEVQGFGDGETFRKALSAAKPSMVLLDIMLPGEDGISLLRFLRSTADTRDIPVILATAKGTEYDKVIGLDLGADDYLVKPFGMMEMLSRIRAVLRRTTPHDTPTYLSAAGVELDKTRHTVTQNGRPVSLTLKEYDLLALLMANPGVVFTRDQLLSAVWGTDFAGETRTVDVHIGTLRTKLGIAGRLVGTVRGVGYRWEREA